MRAMLQRLGRFRVRLPSNTDCIRICQRASSCSPWKSIECALARGYMNISAIQKSCSSQVAIPLDGAEREAFHKSRAQESCRSVRDERDVLSEKRAESQTHCGRSAR